MNFLNIFFQKFQHIAKGIHYHGQQNSKTSSDGRFILFTVINDAHLELGLNWLCNYLALFSENNKNDTGSRSPLRSVIIVTISGGKVCREVHKQWPEVGS